MISKTMPDDFTQIGTSDLYELSAPVTDDDLIIITPKNYRLELAMTGDGKFNLFYTYHATPASAPESAWIPLTTGAGSPCPAVYPLAIHPSGVKVPISGTVTVAAVAVPA